MKTRHDGLLPPQFTLFNYTLRDHIHGQKVILFTHNKKYDMLPSESGDELQRTKFHDSKSFISECFMSVIVQNSSFVLVHLVELLWNLNYMVKFDWNWHYVYSLKPTYSHLSNKRGAHAYRFWKIPPSSNQKSTLHVYWFLRFFHPPLLVY